MDYRWFYQWYTSGFHCYISGIIVVSIGISVVHHWKPAVKFGGITAVILADITVMSGNQWYYHCFATGIHCFTSGNTTNFYH